MQRVTIVALQLSAAPVQSDDFGIPITASTQLDTGGRR
jgi:hypothetical protein